jgi:hypothetical protein
MALTYADIKNEFDQSLGYVGQDIVWLRQHDSGLNYTVGLLIGCGCEMLAAAAGNKNRQGETVLAEMLPAGDWRRLAKRLYTALRDGLAHGFDTKHLEVDGQSIQIYISWSNPEIIKIQAVPLGLGLYIGMKPLSEALVKRIDDFETLLNADEEARERFKKAYEYQRVAPLDSKETEAWRRLVKVAG